MTDWDLNTEVWVTVAFGLALLFLVLWIVFWMAHRNVRRQLDQANRDLETSRAVVDEALRKMDEARGERDQARRELAEALERLEQANRRMMPKIEIHTPKMSELGEMVKSVGEERKRLTQVVAGYRRFADKGLGALKRLAHRPRRPE